MSAKMTHYYSDEWCTDNHKRSQDELQKIAAQIRKGCKVDEICEMGSYFCTIYQNENLGLRYWVKDTFGWISEIDEERAY